MPAVVLRIATRVCGLLAVLAFAGPGLGQITFTKIVDTSTPIPGGTGNFTSFSAPSLRDGNLAFNAFGPSSQSGIYTFINGSLGAVADLETLVPGGTGTFTDFGYLSFDGTAVVFGADGDGPQRGYYTTAGGPLRVSADRNTPMPGGSGNFEWGQLTPTVPSPPSIDHGKVVFYGERFDEAKEAYEYGFYRDIGGSLSVVVDHNTPAPDGSGILAVSPSYLSADSGNVGFVGGHSAFERALYMKTPDSIQIVADTSTPVPGGTGTFTFTSDEPLSLSGEQVAFVGHGSLFEHGIYLHDGASLHLIVDKNTPVPGAVGTFMRFGYPSLDAGNLAFTAATGPDQGGLFAQFDGLLISIIESSEILDGRTARYLAAGPEMFSGNQVAFVAFFTDGSSAIYVATIPEPSALLFSIVAASMGRRRHRQHCPA